MTCQPSAISIRPAGRALKGYAVWLSASKGRGHLGINRETPFLVALRLIRQPTHIGSVSNMSTYIVLRSLRMHSTSTSPPYIDVSTVLR
jgi:hypothetical protein